MCGGFVTKGSEAGGGGVADAGDLDAGEAAQPAGAELLDLAEIFDLISVTKGEAGAGVCAARIGAHAKFFGVGDAISIKVGFGVWAEVVGGGGEFQEVWHAVAVCVDQGGLAANEGFVTVGEVV